MPTQTTTSGYDVATTAVLPEGAPSLPSRISWGAVIAGAVVALTIGLMLNALGAGIGATTVDAAARDTPSASSFGIGAAIWVLVSNLIGLAVGGYVAARLSGTSDNTDGTLHGLAVWGTTFLISAVLLGNLVSGIASTAASGASSLVSSVASGSGTCSITWRKTTTSTELSGMPESSRIAGSAFSPCFCSIYSQNPRSGSMPVT